MTAGDNVDRDDIVRAMADVGLVLTPDMVTKCASLCDGLRVGAARMAETWEAYALNRNATTLDGTHFEAFQQALVQDAEQRRREGEDAVEPSAVRVVPGTRKRTREGEEVSSPPQSTSKESQHRRSVSMSPSQLLPPSSPRTPSRTPAYDEREGAGATVSSHDPHGLPELSPGVPDEGHPCNAALYGDRNLTIDHTAAPYRHGLSTITKRADALEARLNDMTEALLNDPSQPLADEDGPHEYVGVPQQKVVTCVGRVCNEALTEGSLNPASIVLEGPRRAQNGVRVRTTLDALTDSNVSLFPGQIVRVRGVNQTGRVLIAKKIFEGASLPKAKSPRAIVTRRRTPSRVLATCGPYTASDDLDYAPLRDFLLGTVRAQRPGVVILAGPFVDVRHPLLKNPDTVTLLDAETGAPTAVTYETVFAAKVSTLLHDLYREVPDLPTRFVLVPSVHDAVGTEPVYPQPPLSDRRPTADPPSRFLPLDDPLPPGALDLPRRKEILLAPNPCTLLIDDHLTLGVTSSPDVLFHLSRQETHCRGMRENRLGRMARHLLRQRSYAPVFPTSTEAAVDLEKSVEHAALPCTPDVLVLPSKLAAFCRETDGAERCVATNPGCLARGTTGGTYGVITVYPAKESDEDGEELVEHDVHERVRVDVKKI